MSDSEESDGRHQEEKREPIRDEAVAANEEVTSPPDLSEEEELKV